MRKAIYVIDSYEYYCDERLCGGPLWLSPRLLRPACRGRRPGPRGGRPAVTRPQMLNATKRWRTGEIMRCMAAHPFRIVNVFTEDQGPFTGNPLCVFENGGGLSTEEMQALARQFNLSETTFILPSDPRQRASANLHARAMKWPSPAIPRSARAHVCRALKLGGDSLVLEMQAGLIPVRAAGDRWTLTALGATSRELDVSRAELAAALGLRKRTSANARCGSKRARNNWWCRSTSTRCRAARRASPQRMAKIRSEDGQSMAYVFCLDGRRATAISAGAFLLSGRAAPFSKIPPPARPPPTSAHGVWRCSSALPVQAARFRRENSWAGPPRCFST